MNTFRIEEQQNLKRKEITMLGVILAYPLVALLYVYATYYNHIVTQGEAYYFTIGASKIESYEIARELFQNKEISTLELETDPPRTFRPQCRLALKPHAISSVKDSFNYWDYWALLDISIPDLSLIGLSFETNKLAAIRIVNKNGTTEFVDSWPAREQLSSTQLQKGDSRMGVFRTLQILTGEKQFKNMQAIAGWGGRKLTPQFHREDYYLAANANKWILYLDNTYSNTIRLIFEGDVLKKIERKKQNFELPWQCTVAGIS